MPNLLKEILEFMNSFKLNPEDIDYIGSWTGRNSCTAPEADVNIIRDEYSCTWEEFKVLADVEYSPYASKGNNVAIDLIIVFKNGGMMYIDDGEYGGGYEWFYNYPFVKPTETKPAKNLVGSRWPTLGLLNKKQPAIEPERIVQLLISTIPKKETK